MNVRRKKARAGAQPAGESNARTDDSEDSDQREANTVTTPAATRMTGDMILFAQVVQSGTITGGSKALGLERSTVSRRITSLEDRLGVSLLERSTRRLRLTDIGRQYYQHCLRVVEATEDAEAAARGYRVAPSGVLVISAILTEPDPLLTPLVEAFVAQHERIRIDVRPYETGDNGRGKPAELVLHKPETLLPGYTSVKIGQLADALWCAPSFLAAHTKPSIPEQLRNVPIIDLHADQQGQSWQLSREREHTTLRVFPRFHVASLAACRDACRAGAGIARLPEYLCRSDAERGTLVRILPDWKISGGALHAAYLENHFLTRKAKAFIEFVDSHLSG